MISENRLDGWEFGRVRCLFMFFLLQIVKTLFDLFFRREDISRVLLHHTMGACYHRGKCSDEYGNLAVYKPACILHALCVRK
jgi:hypothetical protein